LVKWRFLRLEGDAAFNMAVDEALLMSGVPTLRLYRFRPSAVTIGYFQKVGDSVNLDETSRLGVDVIRRVTGGGSVYHDENGEITYSVTGPLDLFPRNIQDSIRYICEGVLRAIEVFGLKADFQPVNDIILAGKKISGSAQTREGGNLLQHGTLMYDTDLETLAKVLKAPKEKLVDKGVSSIYERVTTLSIELGRRVSFDEALNSMIESFSFLGDIEEGELTEEEWKHVEHLEEKYRSRRWNFRR